MVHHICLNFLKTAGWPRPATVAAGGSSNADSPSCFVSVLRNWHPVVSVGHRGAECGRRGHDVLPGGS